MLDGTGRPTIGAAVEGAPDEAVALIDHSGGRIGKVYGKSGKPHLQKKIAGYNDAARYGPWFVLVDLDNDADCAPPLRDAWLPAPGLCFRIAVHEVEAWLMADPESLDDPKGEIWRVVRANREFAGTWFPAKEAAAQWDPGTTHCDNRMAPRNSRAEFGEP